ncbi:hypothetical protein KAR34_02645 [bacterium]|nr:hypothetical protein [bacterium]
MVLIRITQKLQKELGIKTADLVTLENPPDIFQEWYAHVFILERKKQIIFVETQTLFTFCVPNLPRKDIRERLSEIFEKGLGKALYIEGLSGEAVTKLMDLCRGQKVFAKSENRRTIGAMNEFVKQHKNSFYYQDRSMDTQDRCNRYMPMHGFPSASKEFQFPIEVFAEKIKEKHGIDFIPNKSTTMSQIFTGNHLES